MAIPATCVWEIRPTNGTANAGGGFDPSVASPGTDFSQQNGVQQAYTDLVIDAVTNTDITSVARAFSSVDVGNNIAITSGTGFTTGIYNIRSVTTVIARLDRAVGTTSSTGGNGSLGGARLGFSGGTTTLQASLVAGNTVHVKNEAWNEAVSITVAGASGTPITVQGYNTARSDINPYGSNTNNPVNNRAGAAGDAWTQNASGYTIKNISVTGAGDAGISLGSSGTTNKFINVRSYSNTGEAIESGNAVVNWFYNCELASSAQGYNNQGGFSGHGNYIHDNTGLGISVASRSYITNTISEANGSTGFSLSTVEFELINCVANANTGASSDGVLVGTAIMPGLLMNCILSNNGRDGARATDGDSMECDYNNYYNNSGTARTNVPTGAHDLALDPQFTNAGAGDFSIGTNLKAQGWPGAFPGGLSTGYMDIGAVQRQEAASGGSGSQRVIGG